MSAFNARMDTFKCRVNVSLQIQMKNTSQLKTRVERGYRIVEKVKLQTQKLLDNMLKEQKHSILLHSNSICSTSTK